MRMKGRAVYISGLKDLKCEFIREFYTLQLPFHPSLYKLFLRNYPFFNGPLTVIGFLIIGAPCSVHIQSTLTQNSSRDIWIVIGSEMLVFAGRSDDVLLPDKWAFGKKFLTSN